MLKEKSYQGVSIYKMGRTIGNFTIYPVHSFYTNNVLIDTGTPFAQKEFLKALENKTVSTIINTHYHEDHIGNNSAIQKQHNAEIFAREASLPFLESPEKIGLRLYQKFTWKLPDKSYGKPISKKIEANGMTLDVIEAKGHSVGHICLYEPDKKWLFTGDMFCGIKNIYLREDEHFNEIIKSLEQISQLKTDTIFCGLKGMVQNGGTALKKKIEFMKNLKNETIEKKKKGFSANKIKRKILGKEDFMFYISNGHFSKQNLINSIVKDIKKNDK